MAARIEDYAMIGDCRTAALICRNGSIDWFCCPRFDSSACFAAILGTEENGRWLLAPRGAVKKIRRRYLDSTLVLETTFETESGVAKLIDFMPVGTDHISIMRILKGVRGKVAMQTELTMRFDYGFTIPWVTKKDEHVHTAIAGPHMLVLDAPVRIHGKDMRSVARFTVHEGQTIPFVLTHGLSHLPAPSHPDADAALKSTVKFWRNWSGICRAKKGEWVKNIHRSLITLKGLTYEPTGGMVAAATSSLPEQIAGPRNWDYRYCWLRDATLTLLAFLNAGYREEAENWQNWLMRAIAGSPQQMQTMYGVAGERQLDEWELPWLSGYEGSRPVRVGNAAAKQLQLDVYGELADVMTQATKGGLHPAPRRKEIRELFLQHLERIWREPDEGIWEIRGERKHFTYSKVMAWVAFDRAASNGDAEKRLRTRWKRIAREIHSEVCKRGIDPERGCFVQSYGAMQLDASLLLLPIVGFLPPGDRRIRRTIEEIEKHLMYKGLVMRYQSESGVDGLPPGEGAFLACSFWLADNYLLQGRKAAAEKLFKRLVRLCNDVGLLSEEYDPDARRMLGNFPQAFSHIALVNTALNLMYAHRTRKAKPILRHEKKQH